MSWALAIVLLVLWLAGLLAHVGGALIYLLIALAVIIYLLVEGRKIPWARRDISHMAKWYQ